MDDKGSLEINGAEAIKPDHGILNGTHDMKPFGDRFDPDIAGEVLDAFAHFRNHGHVSPEIAVELVKVYFTASCMPGEYEEEV